MLRTMLLMLALACAAGAACAETQDCAHSPLRHAQLAELDTEAVYDYQTRWGVHEPSERARVALRRLVDALVSEDAQAARISWRLSGYRHTAVNAHAAVTGRVLISSALDEGASSEDALAAAIAHEIGHVVLGHGIRLACLALATVNPQLPLRVAHADFVAETWVHDTPLARQARQLGQDLEREADAFAVRLLARAGYDPQALARLFSEQARRDTAAFARGSHPEPALRAAEAAKLAQNVR